jgi:predicted RNA-binding protein (virulence factor B family)
MVQVGQYNTLKVDRKTDFGFYLDDGDEGILLPKRFAPVRLKPGDEIKVFVYHDSDNRLIATTQQPKGVVGDIVKLQVVDVTHQGAFMDWGLMKDIFVAKSQQTSIMRKGGEYLVKIYIDAQTGRVAATERIEQQLSNEDLTVKERDTVELIVFRKTEIGYTVIINGLHTGMLYFGDIFTEVEIGDRLQGYIKKIRPDNKIDVMPGNPGYQKVEDETEKILRLLRENGGFLPYHDKSDPDDIYKVFGMSKKTFKMTTGALYKQKKIAFTDGGIRAL